MINERLDTVINNSFPEDMAQAIRAALQNGTEWSEEPECINDWSSAAVACGENDCPVGWHLYNHELGFSISDGTLFCDLWSIDAEGDWDRTDSVDMASDEYAGWVDRIVAEDERSWLDYAKYVAQTGDDVLGNYLIGSRSKKVKWQFVISESIKGLMLVKLRRLRGPWMRIEQAPQIIRDFFNPEDLRDFASLSDLKDRCRDDIQWKRNPSKISVMGVREFEEPLPDQVIRRRLIAAAKKHLREKR